MIRTFAAISWQQTPRRTHCHGRRCGLAMVEAVLSTIIIAFMVVAALRTVSASRAGQVDAEMRALASHLAAELMTEIVSKAYEDPDYPGNFGPEPGEENAASRAVFNDVDDFHLWYESPPEYRDGTPRDHLKGWERSVEVAWVRPDDPQDVATSETDVKRIIVTVRRNGMPYAQLTALRTRAVER